MSHEYSNCLYICSRGIPMSCDIYLNSSLEIAAIADIIIPCGTSIFVKIDFLILFANTVLNLPGNKIVLVTGNSDYTLPHDFFASYDHFSEFANNPRIIHWFAQNCLTSHPKITRIPIGLDYHTISKANSTKWSNKIMTPYEQDSTIALIKASSSNFVDRPHLCYANFQFMVNTRYGYDRRDAIGEIEPTLVFYEGAKIDRTTSWRRQSLFAFVICPHGNGMDTHRVWEALVLGCVPIVRKSGLDEIYMGLPVITVNAWSDITAEFLASSAEIIHNNYNPDMLTLAYWNQLISSVKELK
jgi:hypothetical protein